MAIRAISAVPVVIPLKRAARMATRALRAREYVLVHVSTDEGAEGLGYAYAGTAGARPVAAMIDELCAPLLIGKDPSLITGHWDAMYQEMLLLGRRGAGLRALSAVDIALWDLLGKTAGLPLYQLLGGRAGTVPAYASGGYYREGKGPAGLQEELGRYQSLGFTDFKIKVGGASLDKDRDRVRAAREAIGAGARLAVDANNAYRSAPEAVRAVRAFEPYDIWWFEEPLSPDDVAGHARVAAATDVPVATGEIEATRFGFRDLITSGAASILQPDAGVLGGITEWLRVAHMAAGFSLPVAPHWHANLHVHLVATVTNAVTVEYFDPEEDIYNFEAIVAEPLRPESGTLRVPERPGLGVILDDELVRRFAAR